MRINACALVYLGVRARARSHPSCSRITVVGGKPPWPLGDESGSPQGYATTTPVATPQNQPNSTPRVLLSVAPPPPRPCHPLSQTPDPFCVDVNTARGIHPCPILAPKSTSTELALPFPEASPANMNLAAESRSLGDLDSSNLSHLSAVLKTGQYRILGDMEQRFAGTYSESKLMLIQALYFIRNSCFYSGGRGPRTRRG